MGDDTLHLWGKESIEEHINDVVFDLSPRAFFQLNPEQTEVLYNEGIKALNLQPNETVVDAYCGVGTIGLSLAKQRIKFVVWIPFPPQLTMLDSMQNDLVLRTHIMLLEQLKTYYLNGSKKALNLMPL